MALKITAEEVLKRIEQKFGLGVLSFDESSYKGTQKQASFACQVNLAHGSWEALTNNVLKGQGCPQCGRERVLAAVMARSGVTGLELQSEVSQLGYLADLDEERTYYSKETIFVSCSIHGPFTTRPCYIRQGNGCPRCALEKMRARAQNKSAKARDFFEAEIIQKHGPGIIDFTRAS